MQTVLPRIERHPELERGELGRLDAALIWPELSTQQLLDWEEVLPNYKDSFGTGQWRHVPRRLWAPASVYQEVELFKRVSGYGCRHTSRVYVRLPNYIDRDPIVVGVTGDGRHLLLAQWGGALIPPEAVRRIARARRRWRQAGLGLFTPLIGRRLSYLPVNLVRVLAGASLIFGIGWLAT